MEDNQEDQKDETRGGSWLISSLTTYKSFGYDLTPVVRAQLRMLEEEFPDLDIEGWETPYGIGLLAAAANLPVSRRVYYRQSHLDKAAQKIEELRREAL